MINEHKKNVKLFTHTDLDGVGCAVLAMFAFGKDNVDITYCDYNDVNENVGKYIDNNEFKKFDSTFITDISVNDEIANKIDLHNAEVINKPDDKHNYVLLEKLSGNFNRGYTKAIQDVIEIFDYIQPDLKLHHKNLSGKLANELLKVILENRENIREDPLKEKGFIRFNTAAQGFEYYRRISDKQE